MVISLSFIIAPLGYILAIAIVTAVIAFHHHTYSYWKRRGIKGPSIVPFLGSFFTFKKPHPHFLVENHQKYGKAYGVFTGTKPWLVIADPIVIKRIMVQDFNVFRNRTSQINQERIFKKNLSSLRDNDWKRVRSILSAMFTASKLKRMQSAIYGCIDSMQNAITKKIEHHQESILIRSITGHFTMDVIAKCAFATDTNAHSDSRNPFVENARKFFDFDLIRTILAFITPKALFDFLYKIHTPCFYSESVEFFKNLGSHLINQRKNYNERKFDDLLQLMIDAKHGNNVRLEKEDQFDSFHVNFGKEELEKENEIFKEIIGSKYLDEEEIIAQSMIFFSAGYETTANTMAMCLYELAINQNVQQKLFDEIQSVLDDGKPLDYSNVMTLPYLDSVLSETLRKHPPATLLMRQASEDYYIKEYDITVEKNNDVMIPVYAIHHDPEYYPDPERYDPERFMPENRHKLVPYTYLPFGGGPRNCIGMRFALTEAKLGIANMIKSFRIVRTAKTSDELRLTRSLFLLKTEPIFIGIEKR